MKRLIPEPYGPLFGFVAGAVIVGGLMGALTEAKLMGSVAANWAQFAGSLIALFVAVEVPQMMKRNDRREARATVMARMEMVEATLNVSGDLIRRAGVQPHWARSRGRLLELLADDLRKAVDKTTGETNLLPCVAGLVTACLEAQECLNIAAASVERNNADPATEATHLGEALDKIAALSTQQIDLARKVVSGEIR